MRQVLISFLLLPALLGSCSDSSVTRSLPHATGAAGEVMVVIDSELWNGKTGDVIRQEIGPPLAGMPEPEPAFTLLHVTPDGFRDIYVAHRNVIMVLADSDLPEAEVTITREKWSSTQLVVAIAAPDTSRLEQIIREQGGAIRESINNAERERVTARLRESAQKFAGSITTDGRNWEIMIPAGWKEDFSHDDIMMISAETASTTQSVMVALSNRPLSVLGCVELADLTQRRMTEVVKGADGDSFMTIERRRPVSCRTFRRNSLEYIEIKGLWTLEGGYMGGPFISTAFIDSVTGRAVVATGFVYGPGVKKRELLREAEAVIYTLHEAVEGDQHHVSSTGT